MRDFDRIVDGVWSMTTAEDFRQPHTTGPRPFGLRLAHAYVDRLFAASIDNGDVIRAFDRSFNLEDFGEALFAPRIAWHALRTKVPECPLDRVPLPQA
jgi:hypothetical protein